MLMFSEGMLPARKAVTCTCKRFFLVLSALLFEPNVPKGAEEGGLNPRGGTYNWYKKVTNIQE